MLYWADRSSAGGRTLQIADLSAELRRRGHEVQQFDTRQWNQLPNVVRDRVDILHSHGGMSTATVRVLRHRSVPHVATLHGWHRGAMAWLENTIESVGLEDCDVVSVPSAHMLTRLRPGVRVRALVVPNGVVSPRPRRGRALDGLIHILWVGRVCQAKGIDVALQATIAARQIDPALRLHVIGPLEDALARSAAKNPPAGVVFHGYQPDPWNVVAPDMLLHTPYYDAAPRSVLEALGAGVPVISTRVGGIPALVADGNAGLLAESGDADGLAANLVAVASNPALRSRISQAGLARFSSNYSISAMGDRIIRLYSQVKR